MGRYVKKQKEATISVLDKKKKVICKGMAPNQILGMLLFYDYNCTKVGLEIGVHRQTVWDAVNRRRKNVHAKKRISEVLQGKFPFDGDSETLHEAYIRIWGEKFPSWFLELL